MKKVWIFIGGMVAGCIITIVFLYVFALYYYNTNSDFNTLVNMQDITLADQKTEFTTANKFKIFQVLENGALANCEDNETLIDESSFYGPIVYILAEGNNQYYDEQIIKVPKGRKAKQIGIYKYESRSGKKAVPAIVIE